MDGKEYPLPQALRDETIQQTIVTRQAVVANITVPAADVNVAEAAGVATVMTDTIDNDFFITAVTLDNGTIHGTATVHIKKELNDMIYGDVSVVVSASGNVAGGVIEDVIFGKLNRQEMTIQLGSMKGFVKSVTVNGYLASDNKERGDNIGFKLEKKDINIPTGEPLYASLPLEFLQDVNAVYGIDATLKSIELMTNTLAQKIDNELRELVKRAQASNPIYEGTWDAFPSSRFMGSPIEWYETLKRHIDFTATQMMQESGFSGGKFVIIGSPMDINLIQNVNWVYTNNSDIDGVKVQYSVGAYAGANDYLVLSTPNMHKGDVYMFYVSADPDQITLQYYPYAFNVERSGYINPQNSKVPSVLMTRRQAYEVINPLVAKFTILNNTGVMR
jgi:hypothetical protein